MNQSIFKICGLMVLACSSLVSADTLYVGDNEKYKSIDEVQHVVEDGDIIEIAPGIYRDCAVFEANNIKVRPKGWPTQEGKVRFQEVSCEGKAIFVMRGNDVTVQGIEFVNARVPDYNGAGIKFNGTNLLIEDSYFLDNEIGVLTGGDDDSKIVVKRSTFEGNGHLSIPDGIPPGHGLYVGEVASLYVVNSLFINQRLGHHIKSRASYSEIVGNEIADGKTGTASYSIDIPNGGSVLIKDNKIQKGPLSDNLGTAICIACEGGRNETKEISVVGNDFVNDTARKVVFLRNLTRTKEQLKGNVFKGNKSIEVDHYYP